MDSKIYSVSIADISRERRRSKPFEIQMKSGRYIFADSCLCLNNPEYIHWKENGRAVLTDYARKHLDECCLAFISTVTESRTNRTDSGEPIYGFMTTVPLVSPPKFFNDEEKQRRHIEKFRRIKDNVMSVYNDLPNSFSGSLDVLLKWRAMEEVDLANATDLSPRTIRRLRTEDTYVPTTETVIQICIGLRLAPKLSGHLLRTAGKVLRDVEPDATYQFLLSFCYEYSIDICNEILESYHLAKLGRKKKEDSED